MEREKGGSKDPRTTVDVMGFRCVGGQLVQRVCQHSGVKRGFPRTKCMESNAARGRGVLHYEEGGEEKSFGIKNKKHEE